MSVKFRRIVLRSSIQNAALSQTSPMIKCVELRAATTQYANLHFLGLP